MTIYLTRPFLALMFVFIAACGSTPQYAPVTGPSVRQNPITPPQYSTQTNRLLSLSRQQLGIPYRYGGSSPTEGFDCSGLIQYVHIRSGLKVPRTTHEQFRASTGIPLSQIRPGDLVFFHIDGKKLSHVGIYTGHGNFIHAPSSGKSVSRAKLVNPYWQSRFIGARRFM